jgi:hypothetical protein
VKQESVQVEHVLVDDCRVRLVADGIAESIVVLAAEAEDPGFDCADRCVHFASQSGIARVVCIAEGDGLEPVKMVSGKFGSPLSLN